MDKQNSVFDDTKIKEILKREAEVEGAPLVTNDLLEEIIHRQQESDKEQRAFNIVLVVIDVLALIFAVAGLVLQFVR